MKKIKVLVLSCFITISFNYIYSSAIEEKIKNLSDVILQEDANDMLWAALEDNTFMYQSIQQALSAGADINNTNTYGCTLLMYAIDNYLDNITKFLIHAGADVNIVDNAGYSALMLATDNDLYDIVNLLLSKGANVNQTAKDGTTALIHTRDYVIAQALIENGADVNIVDDFGNTALMNILQELEGDIARDLPIITLLINAQEDIISKETMLSQITQGFIDDVLDRLEVIQVNYFSSNPYIEFVPTLIKFLTIIKNKKINRENIRNYIEIIPILLAQDDLDTMQSEIKKAITSPDIHQLDTCIETLKNISALGIGIK